jgi:hypothetical protein
LDHRVEALGEWSFEINAIENVKFNLRRVSAGSYRHRYRGVDALQWPTVNV